VRRAGGAATAQLSNSSAAIQTIAQESRPVSMRETGAANEPPNVNTSVRMAVRTRT
jgi:hypothetical protein